VDEKQLSEREYACLISDMRTCHSLNSKNIVFVIGSGSSEFRQDIVTIMNCLNQFGLEGYFALLSEMEKGLDAFCDKICSKIKEAQFCIAMLNDPVDSRHAEEAEHPSKAFRLPSPNVYYEFGMAVALGKKVIPVIRKDFDLPFDVQHLDAISYESIPDLKGKLEKSIRATLKKEKEEVEPKNSELVKYVYGPLYNEIDRFVSRKDRFTSFQISEYATILNQHKYLFDTVGAELHKEITSFYRSLEDFNQSVTTANRVISTIIAEQIPSLSQLGSIGRPLSLSITLETETSTIAPQLDQLLIRKATPELFLQATSTPGAIKKVTYKLMTTEYKETEINPRDAELFMQDCMEKVENNSKIVHMREQETSVNATGKHLRDRFRRFFR
jgi:predicted nucleotide-binding protein